MCRASQHRQITEEIWGFTNAIRVLFEKAGGLLLTTNLLAELIGDN